MKDLHRGSRVMVTLRLDDRDDEDDDVYYGEDENGEWYCIDDGEEDPWDDDQEPATILAVRKNTVKVLYEDGDEEWITKDNVWKMI